MSTATKRPAGRSGASRPKGKATAPSRSRAGASASRSSGSSGRGGKAGAQGGRGRDGADDGLLASMAAVAAGHATDLWGVALVTVGALAAVAFYGGSLGPAGRDGRIAVGDLLGWGRFLVPPVLIAVGVRLLMGRTGRREDDGDEVTSAAPARRRAGRSSAEPASRAGSAQIGRAHV